VAACRKSSPAGAKMQSEELQRKYDSSVHGMKIMKKAKMKRSVENIWRGKAYRESGKHNEKRSAAETRKWREHIASSEIGRLAQYRRNR